MTRRLSGFRDFRSTAAEADQERRSAGQDHEGATPAERVTKSSGVPPAVGNATVTNQRVRTRFVHVHTDAGERPGLILEWVKAGGSWSARVAYVVDDNATMTVEWIEAAALSPIPIAPHQ